MLNLLEPEIDLNTKYWIWQTIYDGKTDMIECEGTCENWYHPKWLGISDKELEKIIKSGPWICEFCKEGAKK